MNYRWVSKRVLAKELSDVRHPGSDKVFYRAGTINSLKNGLAASVLSKIDFFEGGMNAICLRDCFATGEPDYIRVKEGRGNLIFKLRPENRIELFSNLIQSYFPEYAYCFCSGPYAIIN